MSGGIRHRVLAWIRGGRVRQAHPGQGVNASELAFRRWESAKTNRLNSGRWSRARAQHVNDDITDHLDTLRNRCLYEESNNGFLRGMLDTHTTDIFGKHGPGLQVAVPEGASGSRDFADSLEQIWRAWWTTADYNGQWSALDFFELGNRNRWLMGEWLLQLVNGPANDAGVRLRLLAVDPRRLLTPMGHMGNELVVLGVERNRTGRPVAYYISDEVANVLNFAMKATRVRAADIIHRFDLLEAGQVRGVPVLAPILQRVADLRDYDVQVMDAARAAADWAVYLSNTTPDAPYVEVNESADVERGVMRTLPPGYTASMLQAEQPSTGYNDFVDSQLRAIGRAVGMPLMMVKLDSREHNYSSARFDHQLYVRSIQKLQGRYERDLTALAKSVAREAIAAGTLGPVSEWHATWTWPSPPHVDPYKEAVAEGKRLENGTQSLSGACASHGVDWNDVALQRHRETGQLAEKGLGVPWATVGGDNQEDFAE